LAALQTENYVYFTNVRGIDDAVMRRCILCINKDMNHIKNHFNLKACRKCGVWMLEFEIEQHLRLKHMKKCRLCLKLRIDIDSHNCAGKEVPVGLKCELCGETCKTKLQLQKHKRREHSTKTYFCETCGRSDFKNQMAYRSHIKNAHTEQTFTCNICPAQFQNRNHLRAHKREQHLDVCGQFCDICMKLVISLKTHNSKRHSKTPVNCNICGKEYSNKDSLSKHIQIVHEKAEVGQCEICNKDFSSKKALYKHLKKLHKLDIEWKNVVMKNEKMEIPPAE